MTSGGSVVRRVLVKTGAALAKSAIDYAENNSISSGKDIANIVKNAGLDLAVDLIAGKAGDIGGKFVGGKTVTKFLDKAATKVSVSKSSVEKALKNTNLNRRQKSVIAKNVREGQKVLAKSVKEVPQKVVEVTTKGATNQRVEDVKKRTNF